MYSRSSMGSPSKTALKVLSWPRSDVASGTSSLSSSLMKLTMVVESRPPERHEPTGTSETRRRSTLSRKRRREWAGRVAGAGRGAARPQRQLDPGRRRHVVDAAKERLGAVVVKAVLQVLEDHLV